jgi:aldose sugar dehydrogenase
MKREGRQGMRMSRMRSTGLRATVQPATVQATHAQPKTARASRLGLLASAACAVVLAAACGGGDAARATLDPLAVLSSVETRQGMPGGPPPEAVVAQPVATGLQRPWGMAFLPDGRLLVTERGGALRIVGTDGQVSAPLQGLPPVAAYGQGGLLDIALSPDFDEDRLLWFTLSEQVDATRARAAVARARLQDDDTLADFEVVFRQQPALEGGNHYGSRLAFARDGTLFVTLGDRYLPEHAQDPASHVGKVVRIAPDGSAPEDNPFVGVPGVLAEIWSGGHRNPQGAALDPLTGELWSSEHGPWGGDEINRPLAGGNHGWPRLTYGEAEGAETLAGVDDARPGFDAAHFVWREPRMAPSGMAFHLNSRVPEWEGDLFVAMLAGRFLSRLVLDEARNVVAEERLLTALGERLRDVASGPDGHLYVITDGEDASLLRIELR